MALALACEQPTEPIAASTSKLLVQGVLDLRARYQMISVEYTRSGDTPASVSGATVYVVAPDGATMQAIEDAPNPDGRGRWLGMYRLDMLTAIEPLQPGNEYMLRVTLANGDTAVARTTIPMGIFNLVAHTLPSMDREKDSLRLAWPRIAGASAYEVTVQSTLVDSRGFQRVFSYSTFADTSIVLPGTSRTLDNDPVFPAKSQIVVVVTAVDANYYAYFHPTTDPFAGAPPSRVAGAVGVFGSVAGVYQGNFIVK